MTQQSTAIMDLKHQDQTNGVSYYALALNLQTNNWFWIQNYASIADMKQAVGKKFKLAINEVNEQYKFFDMGDKQKINKARIAQKYRSFFDIAPQIKVKKSREIKIDPTTRNRIVRLSDAEHEMLLKLGGSKWLRGVLNGKANNH